MIKIEKIDRDRKEMFGLLESIKMRSIFFVMCLVSTAWVMPSGVQTRKTIREGQQKQLLEIATAVFECDDKISFRFWNRVNKGEDRSGDFILVRSTDGTEILSFRVDGVSHRNAAKFCFTLNRLLAGLETGHQIFTHYKEDDEQALMRMFGLPQKAVFCVKTFRDHLTQLERTS